MGFSFVQLFADQTDIWSAGYLVMTLCKDTLNQGVDDDLSMAPKAQRAIEQIHSFTDTVLVHQMALPPVFCLIRSMALAILRACQSTTVYEYLGAKLSQFDLSGPRINISQSALCLCRMDIAALIIWCCTIWSSISPKLGLC